MAKDQVLIELQIIQKGGKLSVLAKDTDKLANSQNKQAKSQKKVGKSTEGVIKGQKGIAQTGLSSSKGFSKMNQMLNGGGGSSGLVAAYATLAANVFAATAAFNAFRSAAGFEALAEGFTFMANTAGRTMDLVVNRLKDVAGGALSTEEALQGASLAISGGFSIEKLETLTKVAKGASLALGRNMSDAFDRLTRGAIKLEPEILDELGIMVRLDDATEKYAATINKTSKTLTQFERQTAFINAINEQGIEKYGELADAVDVNPYDQLAASFGDLSKEFLSLINVALIPMIQFFAGSKTGLIGVMVLFSSTIVTTMIPALGQMVQRAQAAAAANLLLAKTAKKAASSEFTKAAAIIKGNAGGTATVKALSDAVLKGVGVKKQAHATERNLIAQLARAKKAEVVLSTNGDAKKLASKRARIIQIEAEIAATRTLQVAETSQLSSGLALDRARLVAKTSTLVAKQMEIVAAVGTSGAFKQAGKSVGILAASLFGGSKKALKAAKSMSFFKRATMLASGAVRLFGAAFLMALPWLAALTIAVGLAIYAYKHFTKELDTNSKGMETLGTVTESLSEKFDQLNKSLDGTNNKLGSDRIRQYKMTAGVFQEIAGGINSIVSEIDALPEEVVKPVMLDIGVKNKDAFKNRRTNKRSQSAYEEQLKLQQNLQRQGLAAAKTSINTIVSDTSAASILATRAMKDAFGKGELTNKEFETFISNIKDDESLTALEQIQKAMNQVNTETESTNQSIINLSRGIQESEKVFGAFFQTAVQSTPFDGITKQFTSLTNEISKIKDVTDGPEILEEIMQGLGQQAKNFGITAENASTEIPKLGIAFTEISKNARNLADNLAQLKNEEASLGKFKNTSADAMTTFIDKQNESKNLRISNNALQRAEYDKMIQTKEVKTLIAALNVEDSAITASLIGETEKLATGEVTRLKNSLKLQQSAEKISAQIQAQFKAQEEINGLVRGKFEGLSKSDEFKIQVKGAKESLKQAKATSKERNLLIAAEYALLQAQAKSDLEKKLISQTTYNGIIAATNTISTSQQTANTQQITTKQKVLDLLETEGLMSDDMAVAALAMFDKLGGKGENLGGKFAVLANQMEPFLANLASMGPEGSTLAAAARSIFTTTSLIFDLKESIKELNEEFTKTFAAMEGDSFLKKMGITPEGLAATVAGFQAVSSVIGSAMAVMKADTTSKTEAVDRQIAAEKRLDGSSAQSLSKIKGMEKKKETIQRKAFETNKKLQIAQAVINTASGMMMSIGTFGPIFGGILAGMIFAVGMKQISLIKKTQFDGGGSAAPTSQLSVGKRDNKVDVSKGASRGETSYLRGNTGVGSGANNFTPGGAGGMRRGYANGGDILVGERGPEVIRPTTTGYNVVPNDKLGGGQQNISFTINAVDAEGVEQLLVAQRGNIIGMIREAANEHGEEFMENINTNAYGGESI